jgi:hypothetical protein
MGCKIRPKRLLGGPGCIGLGLGQEFHFLPQSQANHRVVAVKPEYQGLADIDFLANMVVDQPV